MQAKVNSEASEVPTPSSIFIFYFFLIHRRALCSLLSEAMFTKVGKYLQNMLSEAFWTLNIALLNLDIYPELYSRSKSLPN